MKKPPKILNRIVDKVLAHKPKPKEKGKEKSNGVISPSDSINRKNE